MQLLPVIDILHATAVRGVAGRRNEYRPLTSRLSASPDPLAVAQALHRTCGFRRFYVADLDGILGRQPNLDVYRRLQAEGFEVLLDAGIQDVADAGPLFDAGATTLIAGLESLAGPEALRRLIAEHGPRRIVFSLDLKNGHPLIPEYADWPNVDALGLAGQAAACGADRIIVLDLADVGTGTGGSTMEFCHELLRQTPDLQIITGGGIRDEHDVRNWARTGIAELLVASALHDGALSPEFLREFL
ncbi:MAG: HisA/HisF-related TIM barrel protein [Planctomycetaceae bacterium]